MTTIQDEYHDTLNAWRGSSPKQQQRRLAVKEAGFWSDCAAQPHVPDGAGLISKKAAQQATAVRFPEYDPRSDPHLSQFFERQEERAIVVHELRSQRVASKRAERQKQQQTSTASPNSRPTSATTRSGTANSKRFRVGGKTQASLATVAKQKPVRMPKAPPGTQPAPAPSQRQAQQSDRVFTRHQQQQQQQQRPQSARSVTSTSATGGGEFSGGGGAAFQLDFASHLCPELQALDQFKRHQQHRDEQRERESHRRAIHEYSISRYSSEHQHQHHSPYGVTTTSPSSPESSNHALHSQTTSSNTRTICMPVDSDHVLAVKRLFVRSSVERSGSPCRSEVCAIKNACENFFIILTREVDLPDILYMGIAQSNRFRQVAGLAHMTAVPSPEIIFNWLVILGCTETVDWPSFLILCTADLVHDFDKVADVKTAYQQFTEKTPLDSGVAYQKVLMYLKSVASSSSSGGRNKNHQKQQSNFSANAFHDEMPMVKAGGGGGAGFESEGGHSARTNSPNGMSSKHSKNSFFQPGDFYGPRHTCSFAEALFCLMPYRIQFHLIKANARGFSVSKNFRGRVPHSSQLDEDDHDHEDHQTEKNKKKKKSHRSSSASSTNSASSASSTSTKRNHHHHHHPGRRSPSSDIDDEADAPPQSKAIRFHKFKNPKSRFLEEQAAESRYERKVWL